MSRWYFQNLQFFWFLLLYNFIVHFQCTILLHTGTIPDCLSRWYLSISQNFHKRQITKTCTPHGNNLRGSLCGPKIIIPHNSPTRILYPSNFLTMLSLFVLCRPPTNSHAVISLIYSFSPLPHKLPSIQSTPTEISRCLLPPVSINNHITPHHTPPQYDGPTPRDATTLRRRGGSGTVVPPATSP